MSEENKIEEIAEEFRDYDSVSVSVEGQSLVVLKSDAFGSLPVMDQAPSEIHIGRTVTENFEVRPLGGGERSEVSKQQAIDYVKENFLE